LQRNGAGSISLTATCASDSPALTVLAATIVAQTGKASSAPRSGNAAPFPSKRQKQPICLNVIRDAFRYGNDPSLRHVAPGIGQASIAPRGIMAASRQQAGSWSIRSMCTAQVAPSRRGPEPTRRYFMQSEMAPAGPSRSSPASAIDRSVR
jgi:hypothetical protein